MLVLQRRSGEEVLIDGKTTVTVCDAWIDSEGRPRVKLGFTAPPDVPIVRAELVGRPHKKAEAA